SSSLYNLMCEMKSFNYQLKIAILESANHQNKFRFRQRLVHNSQCIPFYEFV
ncbi:MAG: hypothetical protein ACI9AB_001502, partial [Urechidicola sp.]